MCNVTKRILSLVCVLCVLINALPISLAEDLIAPVVQYEEEVGLTNESPAEPAVIFDNTDQYEGVAGESVVTIEEGAPRSEDRGDEGSASLEPETAQEDQAATMETIVIAEEPASQEELEAPDALIEPVLIEPDDEQKKEKKDESTPNLVTLNEEFRFEASEKSNYVIYLMAPEDGDYHFVSTGEGLWLYVQNIEDRGVIYADKMIKTDPETKVLDYTMSLVQGVYVLTIGNDGQDQESFAAVVYTDAVYQELYSSASQINTVEAEDQKSIGETKDHDNIDENVNKQQDIAEEADLSELAQEQLAENDIADDTADNTVNETVDNANDAADENNDTGVDTNDNQAPGEEDKEPLNNDTLNNDEKTEDENALKEEPTDDVSDEAVNEDGGEEADTEDGGEQMRSLMKMPGVIMPLMVSPENYTYKQYEFRVRFESAASARNNVNLAYEITQISTGSVLDTAELSVEDSNGNNIWITSVSLPEELVSRNDVGIRLVSGVDSNDLYALTDEYVITATTITVRVVDKEDKEVGVNWGLENDYWGSFAQVPEEIHYSVYLKENKQNAVTGNTQQENILYGTYTIGKDDDWEKTIRIPAGCEWYVEAENPDDFICSISSYDPLVIDMTDNTTIYDAYEYHVAIQWEDDDNALGNRPAIENTEITISDERGRTITKNVMIKADEGWFVSINAGVPLSSIRVVLTDPSNDYTYSALGTGATEFVFDATVADKTHIITAELNAKHEFSFGWDDDNNSNDLRPEELTVKYGFGATADEASANLSKAIYDININDGFEVSIPRNAQYLALQVNDNANGTGQNGYYRYELAEGTLSGNKIIVRVDDLDGRVINGLLVSLDGKHFVPVNVVWNDEIGKVPSNIIFKYLQTNDVSSLPENLGDASSISLYESNGWAGRVLVDDDKQYIVYEISATTDYYEYEVASNRAVKIGEVAAFDCSSETEININALTAYKEFAVCITWDDDNNANGTRPSSVAVKLSYGNTVDLLDRDNYPTDRLTISESEGWTKTLYVYKAIKYLGYTVPNNNTEYSFISNQDIGSASVADIETVSALEVIGKNTRALLPLTIVWDDVDNNAGYRPSRVAVRYNTGNGTEEDLLASIDALGNTVVLNEDNNFTANVWINQGAQSFVYKIENIEHYTFVDRTGSVLIDLIDKDALLIPGYSEIVRYPVRVEWQNDLDNVLRKRPETIFFYARFFGEGENDAVLPTSGMEGRYVVLNRENNYETYIEAQRTKTEMKFYVMPIFTQVAADKNRYVYSLRNMEYENADSVYLRAPNGGLISSTLKKTNLTVNEIIINARHKRKLTPIYVVWNDNDNYYGLRPDQLRIGHASIWEGNTTVTSAAIPEYLSEDNSWQAILDGPSGSAFRSLYVYTPANNGVETYSVKFENVSATSNGYSGTPGQNGSDRHYTINFNSIPEDNYYIRLILTPSSKGVYAKIVWDDDGHESERPSSIKLKFLNDDKYLDSIKTQIATLTALGGWSMGVPVPNNAINLGLNIESNTETKDQIVLGNYIYTLTRNGERVPFTSDESRFWSYSGDPEHVIYAEYAPTAKPHVTVEWRDNNNAYGQRPSSISVIPTINGEALGGEDVNASDSWEKTLNLSLQGIYRDGLDVTYDVNTNSEYYDFKVVKGNKTSDIKIICYYKQPISINVLWDDNNDEYLKRSEYIDVVLGDNDIIRVSNSDAWAKNNCLFVADRQDGENWFDHLDEIKVQNLDAFYKDPSITYNNSTSTLTISCVAMDDYTIKKTWNDGNNEHGARPNSVVFELSANGESKGTIVLSADENWEKSIRLPWKDTGNRINNYVLSETPVEGYETNVSYNDYEINVENIEKERAKVDIDVDIVWLEADQNGRPDNVQIVLKASGSTVESRQINSDTEWSTTFEDLPKYDEDGNIIDYTITYPTRTNTFMYNGTKKQSGYDYTITFTQQYKIEFDIAWSDSRRPNYLRYYYKTSRDSSRVQCGGTLYNPNRVSHVEAYVPACDVLGPIEYEFDSADIPGFTIVEVEKIGTSKFILHPDSDDNYVSKTVTVAWDDNDNARGFRPSAVTVEFYDANTDDLVKIIPVSASNAWTVTAKLPKYNSDGDEIEYRAVQNPVPVVYVNTQETAEDTHLFNNDFQEDWAYTLSLEWDNSSIDTKYKYNTVARGLGESQSFKYKLSISTNAVVYEPGQLEVHLPYVLSNSMRQGETIVIGERITAKETGWCVPSDISVPLAPAYNNSYSFNYSIDDHGTPNDKSDDEIVFVNWRELPAGFNQTLSVIYNEKSSYMKDTVPAVFVAKGKGISTDDREIYIDSNPISCSVDTGIQSYSLSIKECGVLNDWDTSTYKYLRPSSKPSDFDTNEYAYFYYTTEEYVFYESQMYHKDVILQFSDEDAEIAYVCAATSSSSVYSGTASLEGPNHVHVSSFITRTFDYNNVSPYLYLSVVVKVPKNKMVSGASQFSVFMDSTLTCDYPHEGDKGPNDKNDIANKKLNKTLVWSEFIPDYSGSIFATIKKNSTIPKNQIVYLKNGCNPVVNYTVDGTIDGYKLQNEDGFAYTVIDDDFYIRAVDEGGNATAWYKLSGSDFYFGSINLSTTDKHYNATTGNHATFNPGKGKVQLKVNDSYIDYNGEAGRNNPYEYYLGSDTQYNYKVTGFKFKSVQHLDGISTYLLSLSINIRADSPLVQSLIEDDDVQYLEIANVDTLRVYNGERVDDEGSNWLRVDFNNSPNMKAKLQEFGIYDEDIALYGSADYHNFAIAKFDDVDSGAVLAKQAKKITNDAINAKVDVAFRVSAKEYIYIESIPAQLKDLLWSGGTFYDLLPVGYAYRPDIGVSVYNASQYNDSSSASSVLLDSVETIDNYKGTGRQMLIVKVLSKDYSASPNMTSIQGGYCTGFDIEFTASISWDDLSHHKVGRNLAVFQCSDNRTLKGGKKDDGISTFGLTAANGVRVFEDINNDGITDQYDTLAGEAQVSPNVATTVENGIHKTVKASSGMYSHSDVVSHGKTYSYKLTFDASDGGKTENIILYDILEEAANSGTYTGETSWKGTLQGVDVEAVKSLGIAPVVYYSTTANLDYNDIGSGLNSIQNNAVWSTTQPFDLSTVTAVAIDLSKKIDGTQYVIEDAGYVEVEIYMRAPSTVQTADHAYNRPSAYSEFTLDASVNKNIQHNIGARTDLRLRSLKDLSFKKQGYDEYGNVKDIVGAKFYLYKCSEEAGSDHHGEPGTEGSCWGTVPVYTMLSGSDGVKATHLGNGVYALKEVSTVAPYLLPSNTWWVFEVDGSNLDPIAMPQDAGTADNHLSFKTDAATGAYILENQRELVDIRIKKTWNGDWTIYGGKPTSVFFDLYRGNELLVKNIEVTEADNWTKTLSGEEYHLYKTAPSGSKYVYSIQEHEIPHTKFGYGSADSSWNINPVNTRYGYFKLEKALMTTENTTEQFMFEILVQDNANMPDKNQTMKITRANSTEETVQYTLGTAFTVGLADGDSIFTDALYASTKITINELVDENSSYTVSYHYKKITDIGDTDLQVINGTDNAITITLDSTSAKTIYAMNRKTQDFRFYKMVEREDGTYDPLANVGFKIVRCEHVCDASCASGCTHEHSGEPNSLTGCWVGGVIYRNANGTWTTGNAVSNAAGLVEFNDLPYGYYAIIEASVGNTSNRILGFSAASYWIIKVDKNGVTIPEKAGQDAPGFNAFEMDETISRKYPVVKNNIQKIYLRIQKTWNGVWDEIMPDSVFVDVYRNNVLYIENIELKASDDWAYTSPLIPKAAANNTVYTYTVKEHESSQYYTASVTQFGTSTPLTDENSQQYRQATIKNSRNGVLYIEKEVSGAPGSVAGPGGLAGGPDSQTMQYKIVLSSNDFVPGDQFKVTVSRGLPQSVTVGETKTVQITLRDGEHAIIENLPVGIYVNAEEIELKPGYTPHYYSYNKTTSEADPEWHFESSGASYTGSAFKTSATAMPMMKILNEYKVPLDAEAIKYVNGHPATNSPYADPSEKPDRYSFRLEIAVKDNADGEYQVLGYSKPNTDSKSISGMTAIDKFEKYGTIGYIPLTWYDASGSMQSFNEIYFDGSHVGKTLYYRIREDRSNENANYEYDDTVYFIIVSISNNQDGTIKVNKTILKDDEQNGTVVDDIIFDNSYEAEGNIEIPVIKLLDTPTNDITDAGYSHPYDDGDMEFNFKISKVDVDFEEYFAHSGMNSAFAEYLLGLDAEQIGDEETTMSGVASFYLNYTEEDIDFDAIDAYARAKSSLAWAFVNTPGCYMPLLYRIDEVDTALEGVQYTDIDSPCFVWVSLYDNGDGTLSPVVTNIIKVHKHGEDPAEMEGVLGKGAPISGRSYFINEYHSESIFAMYVSKNINGVQAGIGTAGKFTFKMINADEDTPEVERTAVNEVTGYAALGGIRFDDNDVGHTYRYIITEDSVNNPDAYTKDTTSYLVEVTISDDMHGGHDYDIKIYNGSDEVSGVAFNNEYRASGELPISATKKVENAVPSTDEEGKFHFVIEKIVASEDPEVVSTGVNGANGTIVFSSIEYDENDIGQTYHYRIRESQSDLAQYGVDDTVYTFDVTVGDNYDGSLDINTDITSQAIVFNNTFRPSLWVENQTASDQGGTVQVVGYDDTLSHASSDGSHNNEENRKYEALSIEANADQGWKIVLEETGIRLKTGEYRYLKDLPQDVNGNYVFSDSGVGALVRVENISEDKMRVSLVALNTDMDISVLFEQNTIWVENTTENDDGGKIKVEGYNDTESEVSSDGHHNNDENRKPTNVVTASANVGWKVDTENVYVAQKDGTKHYVKDLVSDNGEYEFVIANIGQPDERSIKFKIEKTDLRNVRVVIIDMDDDIDIGIPFVRNPVNIRIPVRKTIVGGHEIPHEQTFYFEIAGADGNTNLPSERRIEITGEGTASFDEITFEEANNYSYTIREINQRIPGYTFDSTVHNVTVRVYEDTDGLKTELQDGGEIVEEIAFENAYSPTPVNVSLPVKKTITGNDRPAARERFSFMITPQDNTYPVPASRTLTIRDTGSDTFGTITFAKAGVYTYVVTETAGSARGYEYDHTQHTIVITVVDDNGVLRATWTDNGSTVTDIEFTNNYVPQSTSTSISVRKAITGDARPQQKETFTFSIRPVGDAPEFSRSTTTITDVGTANFGTAEFVKAGVYDYLVTEERGSAVGYTYDTTSHVIRITVTDDNGALTLRATENGVQVGSILFTNTYHPTSTTLSIPVTKIITGAARPAQKEVFEFSITPIGSAPLPAATTVRITDEGSASFLPITFQHAGTYKYSVKERQGTAEGYTYDDTTKTVVVTVTDNAGTLTATYTVDGISADGVTFTNEYQPISTDLLVPVKKIITGSARPAEKEVFKFVIEKVNDEPIPETNLVMIRDEGEAEFLPITYTTVGTYNYRVREIVEDRAGYTYDDTIHALQVKVTDDRGRLVADWTVDGYRAQRIRFTNKYQTTPSSVVIPVRKSISGDVPPTEERFVFEIRPVTSGAPMPVTNLATVQGVGDGAFKEIIFEEAGVYEYIVQERAGSTKGYTYDRNTYKVTVVVEDVDSVLIAKYYVESQGAMVSTGTGTSI